MDTAPVRVLVVDDSALYRKIVRDVLSGIPGVEIIGTAGNGETAVEKVDRLRPDLITLDLEMPDLNGIEVLRRLKVIKHRADAIMVSAFTSVGAEFTLDALNEGAFDFVVKPGGSNLSENAEILRGSLEQKIHAFRLRSRLRLSAQSPFCCLTQITAVPAIGSASTNKNICQVVAIGVSTGGPEALAQVLPSLPANLAVPVLIVQHMPPLFTKSLAQSLDRKCRLRVFEAEEGQLVRAGEILIAPGGKQMRVTKAEDEVRVELTDDPPELGCRPSVDYLFRSVVDVYQSNALGVIMTGMGHDGTEGCRLLHRYGAPIIAQDAESCVVYGMPRLPIEEGIAGAVVPLSRIAFEITRQVGTRA